MSGPPTPATAQQVGEPGVRDFIRVDREQYEGWINSLIAEVRTVNPDLPDENLPALRALLETILDRGYRTLTGPVDVVGYGNNVLPFDQRLTLDSIAFISPAELEALADTIPDRLSEETRFRFEALGEERSENARWDNLFPEGANEVRIPLSESGNGQSVDERIQDMIDRHNAAVPQRIEEARSAALAIEDETERQRALNRIGRDINQREIRRNPENPNRLQTLNPQSELWEQGMRLGRFMEQRNEWALIDDFSMENQRLQRAGGPASAISDLNPLDFITNNLPSIDSINPDNLTVVISRDPQLIGEMSSGQCWRSCMSEDGDFFRHVDADIREGTLVAYVVNSDDTNARYPLMRVLLKPYENAETGERILVPQKTYGVVAESTAVQAMLDETLREFTRSVNGDAQGTYTRIPSLYDDDLDPDIHIRREWTDDSLKAALTDFQGTELKENIFYWRELNFSIENEDWTGREAELREVQRQADNYRAKIDDLGDPETLARRFYDHTRRSTLGAIPTPEQILNATSDPRFAENINLIRPLLDNNPPMFPFDSTFAKHAGQWIGEENGETLFRMFAENAHESAILQYADRLTPYSFTHDTIAEAVRNRPEFALMYANHWIDHPDSANLLSEAVRAQPTMAFKEAAKFQNHPSWANLISEAAQANPAEALRYADNFVDHPQWEDIIRGALESSSPKDVMAASERIQSHPDWEDLARSAALADPESALIYAESWRNHPDWEDLIRSAVLANPEEALVAARSWRNHPEWEGLIRGAVSTDPDLAIQSAKRWQNHPDWNELVREAVIANPESALLHARDWKDHPDWNDLIRRAVEAAPEAALENSSRFRGHPEWRELIEQASQTSSPAGYSDITVRFHDAIRLQAESRGLSVEMTHNVGYSDEFDKIGPHATIELRNADGEVVKTFYTMDDRFKMNSPDSNLSRPISINSVTVRKIGRVMPDPDPALEQARVQNVEGIQERFEDAATDPDGDSLRGNAPEEVRESPRPVDEPERMASPTVTEAEGPDARTTAALSETAEELADASRYASGSRLGTRVPAAGVLVAGGGVMGLTLSALEGQRDFARELYEQGEISETAYQEYLKINLNYEVDAVFDIGAGTVDQLVLPSISVMMMIESSGASAYREWADTYAPNLEDEYFQALKLSMFPDSSARADLMLGSRDTLPDSTVNQPDFMHRSIEINRLLDDITDVLERNSLLTRDLQQSILVRIEALGIDTDYAPRGSLSDLRDDVRSELIAEMDSTLSNVESADVLLDNLSVDEKLEYVRRLASSEENWQRFESRHPEIAAYVQAYNDSITGMGLSEDDILIANPAIMDEYIKERTFPSYDSYRTGTYAGNGFFDRSQFSQVWNSEGPFNSTSNGIRWRSLLDANDDNRITEEEIARYWEFLGLNTDDFTEMGKLNAYEISLIMNREFRIRNQQVRYDDASVADLRQAIRSNDTLTDPNIVNDPEAINRNLDALTRSHLKGNADYSEEIALLRELQERSAGVKIETTITMSNGNVPAV